MLIHEIVLREQAGDGPYLVFPSQSTRENPDLPDPEGKAVIFGFEGFLAHSTKHTQLLRWRPQVYANRHPSTEKLIAIRRGSFAIRRGSFAIRRGEGGGAGKGGPSWSPAVGRLQTLARQ